MYQVVKRDGQIAEFNLSKISAAITKAFEATHMEYNPDIIDLLALRVTADYQDKIQDGKVSVEQIQDSVESVLSQAGYADVAKAYILYRKQREKIRNLGSTMLDYKVMAENDSMYNTPPCWPIYISKLVLEWIKKDIGGLEKMEERNVRKAQLLYDFLDNSSLFTGCADKADRSIMNVTFVTGDKDLDAKFVKESTAAGFVNLKGHRSVGGMRASIYNAMPEEGIVKLVEFMKKFELENK